MKHSRHRSLIFVPALVVVGLTGCWSKPSAAKPTPPATVAHPVPESQLATVTLTEEAEKRLGLQTAAVEQRSLPRVRSQAGEVTLPTSALLTVSAPASGTLQVFKGYDLPRVGARVRQNQPMFGLVPHALTQAERVALAQARLQLAQAKIDAEAQVKQAQVQLDAGKITLARAERLFADQAGTKKDLDDAQAVVHLAHKALDAAVLRQKTVERVEVDAESDKALVIGAPRDGIVRAIFAASGEMVPSGTALFEIMDADVVWIRVPVYVGELADVAALEPAQVNSLADTPGAKAVQAKPVQSPPTAQPQASAVDLYYELANADGSYRPGQRVAVSLRLKDAEKVLGVPWSAVVHDIHGGTWVYVRTAERTYARHRVQVQYVVGDWAVLRQGPAAGTHVVVAGAAEVFGSEFGFGN